MKLSPLTIAQLAEAKETLNEAVRANNSGRRIIDAAKSLTKLMEECGIVMATETELPSEDVVMPLEYRAKARRK